MSDRIYFYCKKWSLWISDLGHCSEHHAPTLATETCEEWVEKGEAKA